MATAEVVDIRPIAPMVDVIVLEASEGYRWIPGQHLALRSEGSERTRYYSIASAHDDAAPRRLELAAAHTGEASSFHTGERLELSEPGGSLAVEVDDPSPLSLVAMGTGVAPLRAIIQSRRRSGSRDIRLLHGSRSDPDRLFAAEFEALAASGDLLYYPVLSQPHGSWTGLRGRLQEHIDEVVRPLARYLLCGSRAMVEEGRAGLVARGVDESKIATEGY